MIYAANTGARVAKPGLSCAPGPNAGADLPSLHLWCQYGRSQARETIRSLSALYKRHTRLVDGFTLV
jgi:hypothetical protein